MTTTSLVCVGSRRYFDLHGMPTSPEALADHNCIVFNGIDNWTFAGAQGAVSVRVRGNLLSNTVETVSAAVRSGVGIGMFHRASLTGDLRHPDIVPILEDFITETRDVSLVWPSRKCISARVRRVTDFFALALAQRL